LKGLLSGEFQDADNGETAGLKIARLIMDGLDGKVYQERIGPDGSTTKTSVSPAIFAKMVFERLELEEALEKPRPLRLLGQDPPKQFLETTETTGKHSVSSPPSAQPPTPNPKDAFDPAELVEAFEYPICDFCIGIGHVRDENGIQMVQCEYCEGRGRAPAPA